MNIDSIKDGIVIDHIKPKYALTIYNALKLGDGATGPKKLGTFGASYLYPVFKRIGVL